MVPDIAPDTGRAAQLLERAYRLALVVQGRVQPLGAPEAAHSANPPDTFSSVERFEQQVLVGELLAVLDEARAALLDPLRAEAPRCAP